MPEHPQLARVGDRLAGQQAHRGRLAGAVRPEQAEADAGRHIEVEAVDGGDLAERLDDAAQLDRVRLVPIVAHSSRVESREPGLSPLKFALAAGR